ncbi:MAG: RtcB family protein [Myxococcales bacterium]|nr:RtcB family protein [Myxococcales bacterium]
MIKLAGRLVQTALKSGRDRKALRETLRALARDPAAHVDDPDLGALARAMKGSDAPVFRPRELPAPWRSWGEDLDSNALQQMQNACMLPVAHSGALMPDAHLGYGLPIGGVLATKNAVIPYAVGVDIACRMRLTVLDIPLEQLEGMRQRLINVLEDETRFGIGASFSGKAVRDHAVMDRDWDAVTITREMRAKARAQLGSSGSGNHFVEYGELSLDKPDLGLAAGSYLALLTHSGSRGAGAAVASTYSKRAMQRHPELPKQLSHLAWLDLDSEDGQEYWAAMSLMGEYAAANHEVIHREMLRALKAKALAEVENHHNFAWKETHDGEDLVVHRKGATPAGAGVLGIIPGSMATPGYVVRGKGSRAALDSASHGAGRVMSRKAAKQRITWSQVKKQLAQSGVTLLSAGLDEAPDVYKDIDQVMAAQQDLVDVVARFEPRIVKMAPAGERPED